MENTHNPTVASQHDGGSSSNQARSRPISQSVRRLRSLRTLAAPRRPVTAIAVHAGAGFHSHANEMFHLQACNDAARVAMKFLDAGASATEAVTIAVKVLEDIEITNAGYGSNLCIDGTVECDASVVDHLGRSGACGAVPNIRNPICLAKTLLDKSLEPLSLRRVPPSFLVGQGAVKFARQHGLEIVPNENLISKNAGDRFHRWQHDLKRVAAASTPAPMGRTLGPISIANTITERTTPIPSSSVSGSQTDHQIAVATGMFNEAQPDSPSQDANIPKPVSSSKQSGRIRIRKPRESSSNQPDDSPDSRLPGANVSEGIPFSLFPALADEAEEEPSRPGYLGSYHGSRYPEISQSTWSQPMESEGDGLNGSALRDGSTSPHVLDQHLLGGILADRDEHSHDSRPLPARARPSAGHKRLFSEYAEGSEDVISDTVGAIAIDSMGRIAAGSSSGGIGMKHRGRVGPAALVGVGSAVIPAHPGDPSSISVAAVASGTGEHIATTMASQRCAERLMRGSRQGEFGEDVYDGDDHDVVESFIEEDFMKHPGVQGMTTTGALGIITVKMSRNAYYFYFGHNTESFALATMASTDGVPQCLMSRLNPDAESKISVGARRIERR